jgi:hypothetical protein
MPIKTDEAKLELYDLFLVYLIQSADAMDFTASFGRGRLGVSMRLCSL